MPSTPRGTIAVDRTVTLLLGIVLLAAGAGAFAWHQGYLEGSPFRIDGTEIPLTGWSDTMDSSWWPWASGGAGVVLALLALIWLGRHLTGSRVGTLRLSGSDATGSLRVDAGAAASAAADELAASRDDLRSARAKVVRDRGQLVAVLEPLLEPSADLDQVVPAAEAAGQKLVQFLGRDDLAYRVTLRVARRDHATAPRVQ